MSAPNTGWRVWGEYNFLRGTSQVCVLESSSERQAGLEHWLADIRRAIRRPVMRRLTLWGAALKLDSHKYPDAMIRGSWPISNLERTAEIPEEFWTPDELVWDCDPPYMTPKVWRDKLHYSKKRIWSHPSPRPLAQGIWKFR